MFSLMTALTENKIPVLFGGSIMVSTVGSSNAAAAVSTSVASTAAIEAQIARYKKALSNCINCDSVKTSQGQADIQALTNKISLAESRLKEITTSKSVNQPATLRLTEVAENVAISDVVAPSAENKISGKSDDTLNLSSSNVGSFVDVLV